MDLTALTHLVRHMEWADALVWNAVLAHPEARGDADIKERLHHAHAAQSAYFQIWNGEPLDVPDVSAFPDIGAVYELARATLNRVSGYLRTLDAESLQRQVDFPWARELVERWGDVQPATLGETVVQLTSHTTYHRGQINKRLRELRGEPPLTDLIVWIWRGRPAPEWEVLR